MVPYCGCSSAVAVHGHSRRARGQGCQAKPMVLHDSLASIKEAYTMAKPQALRGVRGAFAGKLYPRRGDERLCRQGSQLLN